VIGTAPVTELQLGTCQASVTAGKIGGGGGGGGGGAGGGGAGGALPPLPVPPSAVASALFPPPEQPTTVASSAVVSVARTRDRPSCNSCFLFPRQNVSTRKLLPAYVVRQLGLERVEHRFALPVAPRPVQSCVAGFCRNRSRRV
jgi:hypothetical protein